MTNPTQPPPKIHTYPLIHPTSSVPHSTTTTNPIIERTLTILRPHLPQSIPLYRRLQFGRFFPASVLLTTLDLSSPAVDTAAGNEREWIIAFADRSCRPETEVWWFASWEGNDDVGGGAAAEGVLRALLERVGELDVSGDAQGDGAEGGERDSSGTSRGEYAGHASNPEIVLCGAIHERSVPLLEGMGLIGDSKAGYARLVPCHTFVFDVDETLNMSRGKLSGGLKWGVLKNEHFALVRSRTQIPRQDKTLAVLPSLAIFDAEDAPVAWVFVGLDGSLTTLHVEEQWRGRGLAKAITIKLFGEKMGLFWEENVRRIAQGYVIDGNQESVGLCKSLGGKDRWNSYWVRVNLGLLH